MEKSPCCNADIKRIGRADYHCAQCDKDITIDLYYIAMLEE